MCCSVNPGGGVDSVVNYENMVSNVAMVFPMKSALFLDSILC